MRFTQRWILSFLWASILLGSVTWISPWAAHSTLGSVIAAVMPCCQLTEGLSLQHLARWLCLLTHGGHSHLYSPPGTPWEMSLLEISHLCPAHSLDLGQKHFYCFNGEGREWRKQGTELEPEERVHGATQVQQGRARTLSRRKTPSFSLGPLSSSLTNCISDILHSPQTRWRDHSFYRSKVWPAV